MTTHEIRKIRQEYLSRQARASSRQRGYHRRFDSREEARTFMLARANAS